MSEKILHLEILLQAPVHDVWKRWTSVEGIKSFFAPDANLNIQPNGDYEIFFFPENPPGMRGADGQKVMAVQEMKMLSFTWNFPPLLPDIREQRTLVVLRFREENGGTHLTLNQMGFGEGEIWQKGYEYFEHAWRDLVLPRLSYSLEHGPLDWDNLPD